MKIAFKIIDTNIRTVLDSRDGYIELLENRLKFFVEFKCNEITNSEDADSVDKREEVFYHNICYFSKPLIDCIDIFFAHKAARYCIGIYTSGSQAHSYFQTWSEAKDVFDKICNWKYNE